jgi:ABC-type uncharacterized transport system substrate-binding protein
MRRREFIAGLGGAAAWPVVARAQQRPALPVIGYLNNQSADDSKSVVAAFLRGLKETGFVDGDVDIEMAIITLGREPRGGLVVGPNQFLIDHRAPIIAAAARNNVPAVYWASYFPADGGLLSYGVDPVDSWRRVATYVDRILRGEKPGDLPVQFLVKYEMVVNLKTAAG